MSVLLNLWVPEIIEEPMIKPVLTMTQRECDRTKIIAHVCESAMTAVEASELLDVSERHVYRLLECYREEGDRGLIHKLRGRPSNRGYPQEIREHVIALYWKQYRDYGPTLFAELLVSSHKISVDHETVRRWLMAAGGTNVQRKKRPHRRKRERRAALGELVQFDGSPHDWFEERGPACVLLHAIDDASSRTFLRFVPSENSADVLAALRLYCERYGIPRALYVDRGSVFYAENKLTDVGRAMQTLGVEMIFANSPQAKGRVERGNRTHQDRLVKALRREQISTIADANRYLENGYLAEHNKRFAQVKGLPDLHRSIKGLDLNNIFCFQTERHLYNDYTITLDGRFIQLLPNGTTARPLPRQVVTVRRWLDDSLHIFWQEHELSFQILSRKPRPRPRPPRSPAPTHPWRLKLMGKARYASGKTSTALG